MTRPITPVLCTLLMALLAGCAGAPAIDADGTTFVGERADNGTLVFRGVPFAEPPVGNLRWALPQPLAGKPARLDATEFRPACMQSPRILDWYRGLAETFGASRDVFDDLEVSEDCLYLNIWTPDPGAQPALPVIVYFHGGSNSSGWSYEPNYHGHALAGRGAVVISAAYRLGVFGFFSHPDLDDANFGLWDQVAALEWVRENVAHFGGDPERVMVFGESAGAQDVLALMASERARPLFHRAALQSTAGFGIGRRGSPTLAAEQARGEKVAALFGLEGAGAVERLRRIPAEDLFEVYDGQPDNYYHSPVIDGKLLTRPVWDIIEDGELADIPLIIGANADEYYPTGDEVVDYDDVASAVHAKHFLNTPAALELVSVEDDPREAIDRVDTAEYMLCPSQYLAERQVAGNATAWVYHFSRVREGEAGRRVRAYHGAELPYVFGTHDPWMTTTETDWRLAGQMMSYWLNLAATGNPNGPGLPRWPAFAGPGGDVMEFGDAARTAGVPEAGLCELFRDAVGKRR